MRVQGKDPGVGAKKVNGEDEGQVWKGRNDRICGYLIVDDRPYVHEAW